MRPVERQIGIKSFRPSRDFRPVFVIGAARSGTTLVNSIIWTADEFAVYEAESLLLSVCPRKYGNLANDKNYAQFLNDWLLSKQFKRSGLKNDQFRALADANRQSYFDLLSAFMNAIAAGQGKLAWVESTPANIYRILDIAAAIPNSIFVHVIRDGRDVALSQRKLGWVPGRSFSSKHQLLFAALNWEHAVIAGQQAGCALGTERYCQIGFENLLLDPTHQLEKLGSFLGVELSIDRVLESRLGALGKSNSAFGSDASGISSAPIGRWRHNLGDEEARLINTVVGQTLAKLGYTVNQKDNHLWDTFQVNLARAYLASRRFLMTQTPVRRLSRASLEIEQ